MSSATASLGLEKSLALNASLKRTAWKQSRCNVSQKMVTYLSQISNYDGRLHLCKNVLNFLINFNSTDGHISHTLTCKTHKQKIQPLVKPLFLSMFCPIIL